MNTHQWTTLPWNYISGSVSASSTCTHCVCLDVTLIINLPWNYISGSLSVSSTPPSPFLIIHTFTYPPKDEMQLPERHGCGELVAHTTFSPDTGWISGFSWGTLTNHMHFFPLCEVRHILGAGERWWPRHNQIKIDNLQKSRGLHSVRAFRHGPVYIGPCLWL